MNQEQSMSEGLLKQNGIQNDAQSEQQKKINKMIVMENWRSFFLKWITILWWIVVAIVHLCYMYQVGDVMTKPDISDRIRYWDSIYFIGLIEPYMILIGVVLTILSIMRVKTIAIIEIQGRLSAIELQLKRLSKH